MPKTKQPAWRPAASKFICLTALAIIILNLWFIPMYLIASGIDDMTSWGTGFNWAQVSVPAELIALAIAVVVTTLFALLLKNWLRRGLKNSVRYTTTSYAWFAICLIICVIGIGELLLAATGFLIILT
jgi:hypothetical protein